MPRASNPHRPPPGWVSAWEQVGQVKARVRAVAFSPAPLVNGKGDRSLSLAPCILLWLEFENAGQTPRAVRRFQPSGECVLTGPDRGPLVGALFAARSLEDSTAFTQELPVGGGLAFGLLAYHSPAPPAGTLTLTLDAARVGEVGRFVFTIPAEAWKR